MHRRLGRVMAVAAVLALVTGVTYALKPSWFNWSDRPTPSTSQSAYAEPAITAADLVTNHWRSGFIGSGNDVLAPVVWALAETRYNNNVKAAEHRLKGDQNEKRPLKEAFDTDRLRAWAHPDFPNVMLYTASGIDNHPDTDGRVILIRVVLADNTIAAYARPVASIDQLADLVKAIEQTPGLTLGSDVEIDTDEANANGFVGYTGS
jgi:hypothetical protein